jgi:hypothetical protein
MSFELTEELNGIINGALTGGYPILLAAVTTDGKPRMSFRGSIQTLSAEGKPDFLRLSRKG